MLTPASVVATGSSFTVTWRAQPPSVTRICAVSKENFRLGSEPASVAGGSNASGFSLSSGLLRAPKIVAPAAATAALPATKCLRLSRWSINEGQPDAGAPQ
jgi:hypothetical protein